MFRKHYHPWWMSFLYAARGIRAIFLRERNFRFHTIMAMVVIAFGCVFRIKMYEWVVIILVIGMVFGFEIVNTAVEMLCDVVKKERHGSVRRVKDMMAGAVFVMSVTSVLVGMIVFGPYVLDWLINVSGSK